MKRAGRAELLLGLGLLAVFLALRLPGLGRFATADEGLWLRQSGRFLSAVGQADWAGTEVSQHPGVLTAWAGAIGYLAVFPEYAHFDDRVLSDAQWRDFLRFQGYNPVELLAAGRAAVVVLCAAAFAASWPYARRMLGLWPAALGLALTALDPFAIAHQRLLHQDGLMSAFMLLSLLAFMDALARGSRGALLVSGAAAGLSWLTKSPAWVLLPVTLALAAWTGHKGRRGWREVGRDWLLWLGAGLLILVLLFPAAWAAPGEVLGRMVDYAQSSAEGGHSGPVFFNGQVYPEGDLGADSWAFYPLSWLWRSTPLALIGVAGALIFLRRREGAALGLATLTGYALLFALLMTLGIKKFDRYLLPTIFALLLVAGWGWAQIAIWLRARIRFQWAPAGAIGLLFGLQLAGSGQHFPYYLTYYNPLLGGLDAARDVMLVGWGEGLDQAAEFLNEQNAENVASWYSTSFNLLYEGYAQHIPITAELNPESMQQILGADYQVIYIHQYQRETPADLLALLEDAQPVYVVELQGIEYAWVYTLDD